MRVLSVITLLACAAYVSALTAGTATGETSDGWTIPSVVASGDITVTVVDAPLTDFTKPVQKSAGGDAVYTFTAGTTSLVINGLYGGSYNYRITNAGDSTFVDGTATTLCVTGGAVRLDTTNSQVTTTPQLVLVFIEDMQFRTIDYKWVETNSGLECDFRNGAGGGTGVWERTAGNTGSCTSPSSTYNVSFNTALQRCGFTRTETQGTTSYGATIEVTTTESGDVVRGVRYVKTVTSAIAFQIGFSDTVSATTSPTEVFGPRISFSTIVSQTFDSTTAIATIRLLTSVQYPFQLATASIDINDAAGAWNNPAITYETQDTGATGAGGAVTAAACEDGSDEYTVGQPCSQYWIVTIQRSTSCSAGSPLTLDATGWNVSYAEVICHSSFTGACTVDAANDDDRVVFNTASDNYCPNIINGAAATATLKVYDSNTYANENNQFVFGSTSYFEAVVSSSIRIENVFLESVDISTGGKTGFTSMYSDPFSGDLGYWTNNADGTIGAGGAVAASAFAYTNDITIAGADEFSKKAQFFWTWNTAISAATGDFPTTTTVTANLRIRYKNQATKLLKLTLPADKFRLMNGLAGTTQPTTTRATLGVQSTTSNSGSSSSLASASSGTVLIVACALVGLLLFVVVARRRQQKEEESETQEEEQSDSVHLNLPKTEETQEE